MLQKLPRCCSRPCTNFLRDIQRCLDHSPAKRLISSWSCIWGLSWYVSSGRPLSRRRLYVKTSMANCLQIATMPMSMVFESARSPFRPYHIHATNSHAACFVSQTLLKDGACAHSLFGNASGLLERKGFQMLADECQASSNIRTTACHRLVTRLQSSTLLICTLIP